MCKDLSYDNAALQTAGIKKHCFKKQLLPFLLPKKKKEKYVLAKEELGCTSSSIVLVALSYS